MEDGEREGKSDSISLRCIIYRVCLQVRKIQRRNVCHRNMCTCARKGNVVWNGRKAVCMYEQMPCACVSMGKFRLCFDAKWYDIDCAVCADIATPPGELTQHDHKSATEG